MATVDFTNLSAALTKVIRPAVESQMYERAPMWQLVGGWSAEKQVAEKANVNVSRMDFQNNEFYIPIRTSYHSGYAAINVGANYNYGKTTMNETKQSFKTLVSSFTIPKQVLKIGEAGAVVKPLVLYSRTLAYDLAMQANRQAYQDGSGVVAKTASAGSSTTTVDLQPSTNGDIDYARYLPVGARIRIGTNSVTKVAAQTGRNQITIEDAQSWSAGANIYLVDGDGNVNSEIDGFGAMVRSSGTYQNLSASSAYVWSSPTDETAETITKSNIGDKIHALFLRANSIGKVDFIVMNATAYRTYGNSLVDKVRFTPKEVLTGGWIGLAYDGGNATILLDYDCPDDTILGISSEDLVFGQAWGLEFEKGTEGTLLKINQKLDYEVTASWAGNFATLARGAHFALRNKTFNPTT